MGGSYWSVSKDDYEANCEEARKLLAEAGYENGVGFPETTYLYNTDDKHQAVAEALQSMWKNVLGVEVTLNTRMERVPGDPFQGRLQHLPATAGLPTTTTPCPSWICS